MTMLRLIASGAYVEQELAAEFGQVPPSFLPVGTSRLYEAQVAHLGLGAPIYLTVPENFVPQAHDERHLQALGVVLVPVPVGLRLGESIIYAINSIDAPSGPMQLLHGDTLIEDIPAFTGGDAIAIHGEGDDYSWAVANVEHGTIRQLEEIEAGTGHESGRPVACGYFAFSSSTQLIRAITRARGDFIGGLNLYVQDRPARAVDVERWRDFGHIQTYFRSRRAITTARSFNTLRIDARCARKSSQDSHKIRAEAAWFKALPPAALPYSARLLEDGVEDGTAFYTTEYQYSPTLSELFVFSSIGRPTWRKILQSCEEFLVVCAATEGLGSGETALAELTVAKTVARLERYARETGFDLGKPTSFEGRKLPSLLRIAEDVAAEIDLGAGRRTTLMHGDFCFSNILYNSRAGRISVIDPRGYIEADTMSCFGDVRYDLAKLSHSVSGNYDLILAGRYALRREGSHDFALSFEPSAQHAWLQRAFEDLEVDGIRAGSRTVRAITVGLFLSMLPLHADRPDRQAAFIANSLRLYAELQGDAP